MCLTGKLAPDFKTIADFRRNHGASIKAACRCFVLVCRNLGLIAGGTVAVDGSRLSLARLQAEVERSGLLPIEVEVVGTRGPVIVSVWCDLRPERLMPQEVVPLAAVDTAKEALAGVWLRWLAHEDERRR